MKKCILNVVLLFCVIVLGTSAQLCAEPWNISQSKFTSNYEGFAKGILYPPELGANSRHETENLHYVFITGFLAFQYPDYFREQMKTLESLGVPKRNIHLLQPPSRLGIEQSTGWLKRELENIPGKLVLIAHSKGGAEAFTLALKNSPLIENHVDDMYLLQAAIGGSSLSDIMLDRNFDWSQFKSFTPEEQKTVKVERMKAQIPKYLFRPGMNSLRTPYRHAQIEKMLIENAEDAKVVSPKIHYLTSSIVNGDRYILMYRTHWKVLSQVAGISDGVVQTDSQSVDGVGNIIFHSDAGHGDYTNPKFSVLPKNERVSLIKSIATAVETKNKPDHPLCSWILSQVSK